ncbi:MAG: hypothetical protein AAF493_04860 [Pseudomonadota bacterium]
MDRLAQCYIESDPAAAAKYLGQAQAIISHDEVRAGYWTGSRIRGELEIHLQNRDAAL